MYSKILMVLVFGFVSILHSQVTTYMECLLFNINGQLIKQFTLDEIQGSYTIKDLSSGMYILKAESVQYKLIIE